MKFAHIFKGVWMQWGALKACAMLANAAAVLPQDSVGQWAKNRQPIELATTLVT